MCQNALTKQTANLFPRFSNFQGFYLVGGTALALQIGHRLSVDLDFFTSQPLSVGLLNRVKKILVGSEISVTYRAPEQLNLLIDGVKVTFFQFEYPVIDPLIVYQGIQLASVQEIASMKAFAIGKRLVYKDYVDWYFLLTGKHLTLPEVIAHARKKFESDFNDRLFLGQLASLEDVETQKIDFLQEPIGRSVIEQFLKDAVRELIKAR